MISNNGQPPVIPIPYRVKNTGYTQNAPDFKQNHPVDVILLPYPKDDVVKKNPIFWI
jgi:hypothetical protein